MRTLIQRVARAQAADSMNPHHPLAAIGRGLVVLAGFEATDSPVNLEQMAQKIRSLRIFTDSAGQLNLPAEQVGAHYMVVSEFTLYAELKYGNRPSFDKAADKKRAKEYYEHFARTLQRIAGPDFVQFTPFGATLEVELVNDGPVTIWLDSREIL